MKKLAGTSRATGRPGRNVTGYAPVLLVAALAACSSSSSDGGSPAGGQSSNGGSSSQGTSGAPAYGGQASTSGGAGTTGAAGSAGSSGALAGAGGSTGGSAAGEGGAGGRNPDAGGNTSGGGRASGGASGHAGSGGGAGGSSGGAGGQGGSTDCGFTPVTPNATAATKKVLCYLHSIYGNHILSGQEEDNNDNGMNTIFAATGKYPAIRAFDVNNSMAPTQCVKQWQSGGLCMFGYHMGINGGTYSTPTNIGNVLTSGTAENKSFNADLDRIAQYVTPVQQAGGVAILRMFHEAGKGCSWFWWSMGTSAQWQQLFKYAFNYLTATKGLTNVLWIAPLCGSPDAAYNPGSQYIDIGGADTYQNAGDYQPLTSLFNQTQTAFPNMMVALHECGPIPDPAQLKSSNTKWLFFNVWATPYFTPQYNPVAHLQAVYSSDYVITRDELPSFN